MRRLRKQTFVAVAWSKRSQVRPRQTSGPQSLHIPRPAVHIHVHCPSRQTIAFREYIRGAGIRNEFRTSPPQEAKVSLMSASTSSPQFRPVPKRERSPTPSFDDEAASCEPFNFLANALMNYGSHRQ